MATVVYVAPHQDDETLSMGPSIRRHIEVGHEVHAMLVTPGVNSAARPATGLSRAAFAAARDDEFFRACRALGIPFDRIHISRHSTSDGALTVQAAEDAISEFASAHPGVWVKTYTNLSSAGRHVDHINAGKAAVNLLNAGTLAPNAVRLYVEPWVLATFRSAHPAVALSADTAAATGRVLAACDEYQDVDHPGGRYGIGYLSVGQYFESLRANPVSRYHVPTA